MIFHEKIWLEIISNEKKKEFLFNSIWWWYIVAYLQDAHAERDAQADLEMFT